jgi:hypothetical protein
MGMKSAACWFAPKWQVRTKALGEAVERTVRFDIATIVRDELEELDIDERPAAPNDHFTEVALDELHHVPVGRTLGKIKEHPLPPPRCPSAMGGLRYGRCHAKPRWFAFKGWNPRQKIQQLSAAATTTKEAHRRPATPARSTRRA